jgi:large subunit ribosomal protein L29
VKSNEVHALDDGQLLEHVRDARQEVFNLRFQLSTGQLENTARVKQAKKDLARGLTVARERGIDLEHELRRQRRHG